MVTKLARDLCVGDIVESGGHPCKIRWLKVGSKVEYYGESLTIFTMPLSEEVNLIDKISTISFTEVPFEHPCELDDKPYLTQSEDGTFEVLSLSFFGIAPIWSDPRGFECTRRITRVFELSSCRIV